MSFFKDKPYRNKKYLKYLSELPCSCCGIGDDTVVAHHIIGVGDGSMGGKACDMLAMPLCFTCHTEIHNGGDKLGQWKWVAKTLQEAAKNGFF